MILKSEHKNPYGQNPFCFDLNDCIDIDDVCDEIKIYANKNTRLDESTIIRRLNYVKLMAHEDQLFPIDFLNPSYPQNIYHMGWYKREKNDKNTHKNFYGHKQRKEAYETYLDTFGINKGYFEFNLPEYPKATPINFPNPDIVFEISRYNYFKDKDENRLYQFMHLYNLIVGGRPPSETVIVVISSIDWDNLSISHPMLKLNNNIRKVFLDDAFINGKTRKSLKNYVDYIRPKFVTQYSGDYLFISPKTGKPFTRDYCRKHLTITSQMVYPEFNPYQSRHFCATCKLIEKYIEKYPDPILSTKNFRAHTTRKKYRNVYSSS